MSKIYRYTSFVSFVDIVLSKRLIFVHPSLLEDPFELHFIHQEIENRVRESTKDNIKEIIGTILENVILNKLYVQSWARLNESDALWRIYSHGGTSVRISTDTDKIKLLDDVEIIDVTYENKISRVSETENSFYNLIGTKRTAFAHEEEVRLIKHYRYSSTEDAKKHVTAFLALHGKANSYFDNINEGELEKEIQTLVEMVNHNIKVKTLVVPFSHIDNFIESVLLNPFAPDWVDKTLALFCEENGLNYLGKSKLYKKQ